MRRYDIHALVHLPHWHQKRLTPFFAAATLRTFASSMVSIFIPLYIYTLAREQIPSLSFTAALLLVILYHVVLWLAELLVNFPAAALTTRIGFKMAILISNLLLLGKIVFLLLASSSVFYLIPAAMAEGALIPFYWIPYHFIFTKESATVKFGRELSFLEVFKGLASVAGPVVGGLMIAAVGFRALYLVIFVLVLLSTVPIFVMRFQQVQALESLQNLWQELRSKRFRAELISFAAIGAEGDIGSLFWPLFVYLSVGSFYILGALTSLALVCSLLIIIFVGYWVDHADRAKTLRFGGFSNAVIWILRLGATTVPRIFVADLLSKTLRSFLWVPFDVLCYTKARHRKALQFLVLREWAINGGRLVSLVLIGFLIMMGVNWLFVFLLAALLSPLTILMSRGSEQEA